jgi:hypothetical protein
VAVLRLALARETNVLLLHEPSTEESNGCFLFLRDAEILTNTCNYYQKDRRKKAAAAKG